MADDSVVYIDRAKLESVVRGALDGPGPANKAPFFSAYTHTPASEIPPRRFLYGRHYIRQYASATFAPGAAGKSALQVAEALAMATGRPLLGVQPNRRCKVGYINLEDPLEETQRRVSAAMLHFDIAAEDIDGWFFWGSGRDRGLVIAEQLAEGVIIRPDAKELEDLIRETGLDVLQVDPFVSSHQVQENDNGAIDKVGKEWGRIAGATNTSIDLAHHTTKAAIGHEVKVEHGRGGGALLFAVRSARVINTMSEQEATDAGVAPEDRRWHFRTDNGKANLSPPSRGADWFKFQSVDLGNVAVDPDYPQGDNVGVVTSWQWPGGAAPPSDGPRKRETKLNYPAQVMMRAFTRLFDEGKTVLIPTRFPGVDPGVRGVTDGELRKAAYKLNLVVEPKPDEADRAATTRWQNAARKAWQNGTAKITEGKLLRFEEGFIWDPKFRPPATE